MRAIWGLTKRNMKRYYRDKTAVFFSFLSVFILLLLYMFFLGDLQTQQILGIIKDIPGAVVDETAVSNFVNGWLIAGVLAINTLTITLTITSLKVEDKYSKIINDFNTTPITRNQLQFGYLISSWIIGMITSIGVLIIGEVFIVLKGGQILSAIQFLEVLGVCFLSIFTFSVIFYTIMIFIQTASQVHTFSALMGTFGGFLAGIYIPVGVLGKGIANIINLFPLTYIACMLRNIFSEKTLPTLLNNNESAMNHIKKFFGYKINIFSLEISSLVQILILVGITIIFFTLSLFLTKKLKNSKFN